MDRRKKKERKIQRKKVHEEGRVEGRHEAQVERAKKEYEGYRWKEKREDKKEEEVRKNKVFLN